jgi:hypothetical protein
VAQAATRNARKLNIRKRRRMSNFENMILSIIAGQLTFNEATFNLTGDCFVAQNATRNDGTLSVIPLTAYPASVGGTAKRPTQREERVFITLLFYGKQRTPASDRRPDLR